MKRAVLLVVVAAACGDNYTDAPAITCGTRGTTVSFRLIATLDGSGVLATAAPDDDRLFVVQQNGAIRIVKDDRLLPTPFLDLGVDAGGPIFAVGVEQGLLGLAFHPSYAQNGTFFVYYTTETTDVIARYQVSATDPDRAEPAGTVVLAVDDYAPNHNGGMLAFGPDHLLYAGLGDGGGAGDPHRTALDPQQLLGKMLRLDIDQKSPGLEYSIPPGNPFATAGGRPEIFALGLRNPWRWSFDARTGDLWIADVGQNEVEEVDVIPAGTSGQDFGWSQYEGNNCFNVPCDPVGKTMPVWTRTHADGWCSITGGAVYRGSCYPDLDGQYFATDYCKSELMMARAQTTAPLAATLLPTIVPAFPASLTPGPRGELYLTTAANGGGNGAVYRLEAGP